ncbi:imidazole glycerol phosphate synthase subunit HisH [Paraflavitalea sp. CAU 1676]|uniref:imidazole glycerol phosphate synthase subunit HisH n=1 Tax=Paraflavitalea sp. CAU 1676 TaxID=3032598 RepID=UPI0023D9F213|nr:imidazole glycerol phosphate synthase subunit HisH [Paraflavitalea sp. CAU 1676]MDF2187063.1 imidazole glycerol phosphate synthase subunit HisH [Paraflavitalea sp. CAU 1676]
MNAIVNYGLGNLTSILNMHRRLGIPAVITSQPEEIRGADRILIPGVGHFKKGMDNLHQSGLKTLLDELVLGQKKPVLGICLGAQLLTKHSEEGDVDGLGWVDAVTIRFDQSKLNGRKVPHMGWNDVKLVDKNPLWEGLQDEPRFYHVHSYHFQFERQEEISATATYGYEFATAFRKGNIYGTQFHPEKSHKFGMKVLENFSHLSQ